jgi:hypothetical protein
MVRIEIVVVAMEGSLLVYADVVVPNRKVLRNLPSSSRRLQANHISVHCRSLRHLTLAYQAVSFKDLRVTYPWFALR